MKLPYFKFYPKDFEMNDKVLAMELPHVGLYLKCLNAQWLHGSIPADVDELALTIRVKAGLVRKYWPQVARCFIEASEPGRLINPRMEDERQEATEKSGKASTAAKIRHEREREKTCGRSAESMRTQYSDVGVSHQDTRYGSVSVSVSGNLLKPEKQESPLELAIDSVAVRIHGRHPEIRRCSLGEVKTLLRSIVRKIPASEKIALLYFVDAQHEAWCASEEWQKDCGQFAKGLDNWLAPTKRRWENNPPDQVLDETQLMIAESWAAMEAKNGNN